MRRFKWLLPLVALALLLPVRAQAQQLEKPWLFELSGAYVLATGEWGGVVKDGWTAGGMVGYGINPAIYVLGSFNALWYSGVDNCAICPNYTNYSYFGMIGYNALAQSSDMDALVMLGAGGMTFKPEDGESNTNFALNGGIRAYRYLTPSVGISFHFMAAVAFTDETAFASSTVWTFPVGLGLVFRF